MPDGVGLLRQVLAALPLHGIGGRQDLPVPFPLAVTAAALAVGLSFVVLALGWHTSRYGAATGGWDLGARFSAFVDSGLLRWSVRLVGLLFAGYVGAAVITGPDRLANPVFGAFYVLVWVGLVPLSLALGPVWVTLNPWRTLCLLAARLRSGRGPWRELPAWCGIWPAAVGVLGYAWLELVAPDRATLPVLQRWLLCYAIFMVVGMVVFGSRWVAAADPFDAYARLIAKMSAWGRHPDGRIALREPLQNLDGLVPLPGTLALVAALLGSTAYDGFSGSTSWQLWSQDQPISPVLLGSLMLLSFVLLVFCTFGGAALLAGRLSGGGRRLELPGQFVHSLVPIVVGYVVAHYLTLFWLEGQRTVITLSDPWGRGWNVFGTAGRGVDASIADHTTLIATVQVAAVVIGHVLGVISAHDRAVKLLDRGAAIRGQLPLMLVMVGYTVGGLYLLFSQ